MKTPHAIIASLNVICAPNCFYAKILAMIIDLKLMRILGPLNGATGQKKLKSPTILGTINSILFMFTL